MTNDREQRDCFVVRIWREKDQPGWKGWVQNSRTGRRTVLQEPEKLLAFIQAQICKAAGRVQKGLR